MELSKWEMDSEIKCRHCNKPIIWVEKKGWCSKSRGNYCYGNTHVWIHEPIVEPRMTLGD